MMERRDTERLDVHVAVSDANKADFMETIGGLSVFTFQLKGH